MELHLLQSYYLRYNSRLSKVTSTKTATKHIGCGQMLCTINNHAFIALSYTTLPFRHYLKFIKGCCYRVKDKNAHKLKMILGKMELYLGIGPVQSICAQMRA